MQAYIAARWYYLRPAANTSLYYLTMSSTEDVLVSFRAGLMNPENNALKADQRKGSVQVVQVRASSG